MSAAPNWLTIALIALVLAAVVGVIVQFTSKE
jgi:hypothetical protein